MNRRTGEQTMSRKLDDYAVHAMRVLRRIGFSRESISALYGCCKEMLVRIDKGKSWTFLHTADDHRAPQRSIEDASKLRVGLNITAERRDLIHAYAKQLTADIEAPDQRERAMFDLMMSWAGIGGAKTEQDGNDETPKAETTTV
jgi:hypothetical protein